MADIETFESNLTDEEKAELEKEETTANPESGTGEPATPAATPTEEKTDDKEETGSDPEKTPDEKLPFHEHPRWIARENRLKKLEADLEEERAQRIAEREARAAAGTGEEEEIPQAPDWFVEAYGDDPEVYRKYLVAKEAEAADIEERAVRRLEEREQKKVEEQKAQIKWVEDSLAEVRENLKDGEPDFDNNELLAVLGEYQPSKLDDEGVAVLDFRKGYELLQLKKQGTTPAAPKPNGSVTRKKDLASSAPATSGPEEEVVASNETFANGDKPW